MLPVCEAPRGDFKKSAVAQPLRPVFDGRYYVRPNVSCVLIAIRSKATNATIFAPGARLEHLPCLRVRRHTLQQGPDEPFRNRLLRIGVVVKQVTQRASGKVCS